jgi:hypothetical protein
LRLRPVYGLLAALAFPVLYLLLFAPDYSPVDLDVEVGEVLSSGLIAPVGFEVMLPDSQLSRLASSRAEEVAVYFRRRGSVWPRVRRQLESSLARHLDSGGVRRLLEDLEAIYREGVFDSAAVRRVYQGDEAVVLEDGYQESLFLSRLHSLQSVRGWLTRRLRDMGGPAGMGMELFASTVTGLLDPNLEPDPTARADAVELIHASISPVDTVIAAGDTLVPPGGVVTSRTKQYVESMQSSEAAVRSRSRLSYLGGRLLLILGALGLTLAYVRDQMADTWNRPRRFLLLATIWLLTMAGTGAVWRLLGTLYNASMASLISFGAVLTAIFFHRRDAYAITAVFALVMAASQIHPYMVGMVTFVSGSVAAGAAWDIRSRSNFPRAVALAALAGVAAYWAVSLIGLGFSPAVWWVSQLEIVLSPVVGIGAASVLLFAFERVFGVYTALSIDEATSRHHPLLDRLSQEAMGSWQHSQAVADLASEAAEAIGADPALAQAGGLFHDVGKLYAPRMFIENQDPDEPNPHDDMDPRDSARAIVRHVEEGVKLARKSRVPGAVVDIIRQSHGDSLTRYFYEKARKSSPSPDALDSGDFRYPGPRPLTREAGLVLLADVVESATKNLADTDGESLSAVINRLLAEKEAEGQLDHCHLTKAQLKKVAETFAQVLRGRYHSRVKDFPHGRE